MVRIHSDELYDSYQGPEKNSQKYWVEKNYKGWEHLIRPCIDRAVKMKHNILQIKAKFGSLRFYWSPVRKPDPLEPDYSIPQADSKMDELVKDAEVRSEYTCTNCGLEDKEHVEMGHCKLCKDGWWNAVVADLEE